MESLFLAACRGQATPRPPLWLMRQAGRYLPEYREIRNHVSFLELCKTPELAAEVTLQPIRRFGFDAAILFSDLLIPLEAMGLEVHFTEQGPQLPAPVRSEADLARLRVFDPWESTPFVCDTIRQLEDKLGETPLIGFAGAPLTLAAYMVEGGGSRHFVELKRLLWSDAAAARTLMGKLTTTVIAYLKAQVAAGAQAVQLFDTWAGILAPADFEEHVLPYVQRIVTALRPTGVPVIYFVNGAGPLLGHMRQTGADVLGLDWRVDLRVARATLGPGVAVQGNLDPVVLFAPPEEVARRVGELLIKGGGRGHIVNLGHGILPDTPIRGVEAMLAAVRQGP